MMEKHGFAHNIKKLFLITGFLFVLLSTPIVSHAAKFYKWVDDNGIIRYGDRIPPVFAQKKQHILNDQGIVIATRAAAKTKQQLALEARQRKLTTEILRLKKAQASRDRVLLDTYSNEEDIINARDGKIEAIDNSIQLAQTRISKGHVTLAESKKEAAQAERAGRAAPKNLGRSIKTARAQIKDNEAFIQRQTTERQRVLESYNTDLVHFYQLMLQQKAA
ncbi:MAG: DUF4124 domain-containing protein, partial [Gammaproteobacteria bacterium]